MRPTPHAPLVLEAVRSAHQQLLISNARPETLRLFIGFLGYGTFFTAGNAFAAGGQASRSPLSKADILAGFLSTAGSYEELLIIGDSPATCAYGTSPEALRTCSHTPEPSSATARPTSASGTSARSWTAFKTNWLTRLTADPGDAVPCASGAARRRRPSRAGSPFATWRDSAAVSGAGLSPKPSQPGLSRPYRARRLLVVIVVVLVVAVGGGLGTVAKTAASGRAVRVLADGGRYPVSGLMIHWRASHGCTSIRNK